MAADLYHGNYQLYSVLIIKIPFSVCSRLALPRQIWPYFVERYFSNEITVVLYFFVYLQIVTKVERICHASHFMLILGINSQIEGKIFSSQMFNEAGKSQWKREEEEKTTMFDTRTLLLHERIAKHQSNDSFRERNAAKWIVFCFLFHSFSPPPIHTLSIFCHRADRSTLWNLRKWAKIRMKLCRQYL